VHLLGALHPDLSQLDGADQTGHVDGEKPALFRVRDLRGSLPLQCVTCSHRVATSGGGVASVAGKRLSLIIPYLPLARTLGCPQQKPWGCGRVPPLHHHSLTIW